MCVLPIFYASITSKYKHILLTKKPKMPPFLHLNVLTAKLTIVVVRQSSVGLLTQAALHLQFSPMKALLAGKNRRQMQA